MLSRAGVESGWCRVESGWFEGFRCKTHYIHLVHSEKFHVLRTTLNAFCHKSDNSALHSTADNAFCATTLLV